MITFYKSKKEYMSEKGIGRKAIDGIIKKWHLIKLDTWYYSIKDLFKYCLKILLKD